MRMFQMATSASSLQPVAASGPTQYAGTLALAGRVLLAAIFVMSGLSKIADPVTSMAYITAAGLPAAPLALASAITTEVIAGIALIPGLRTRFAAAALALFSIATALLFHSALSDPNQLIHFTKNL